MDANILKQLLKDVNGGTFISIDTETDVKLTGGKSNPFQGRVTKRAIGHNVMVFQNKTTNAYENMVNRRLEAEGRSTEFEVGPRQWGTRIPNTPFVEHNGKTYLEVIFLKPGAVELLVDGKQFVGVIEGMREVVEGDQGGLENKVVIRTFGVDSIKGITVNKQHFV